MAEPTCRMFPTMLPGLRPHEPPKCHENWWGAMSDVSSWYGGSVPGNPAYQLLPQKSNLLRRKVSAEVTPAHLIFSIGLISKHLIQLTQQELW